MNIPDKAYEAAELAGEGAYVMGGVPEDVSKAAIRAAAPFIAAQAWQEGFKQGGPMHDVNYDDPDAHTRNPYKDLQ